MKQKWLIGAVLALTLTEQSFASNLGILEHQLEKGKAGHVEKSFAGPDGLTGVVLKTAQGNTMIGYVTPDGRYLVSGLVVDLMTGKNLTANYSQRYIGKVAMPSMLDSQQAAMMTGKMQGAVFGSPTSPDYIGLIYDPSTQAGREAMSVVMTEAAQLVKGQIAQSMSFRFYPTGPVAPQLLAGSNQDRLRSMLAFTQGKGLPAATSSTRLFAQRNDAALAGMPVKPPVLLIVLPQKHIVRALHVGAGNQLVSAIGALGAVQAGGQK
jgi:thiol:disulfide interchange protein DsbG